MRLRLTACVLLSLLARGAGAQVERREIATVPVGASGTVALRATSEGEIELRATDATTSVVGEFDPDDVIEVIDSAKKLAVLPGRNTPKSETVYATGIAGRHRRITLFYARTIGGHAPTGELYVREDYGSRLFIPVTAAQLERLGAVLAQAAAAATEMSWAANPGRAAAVSVRADGIEFPFPDYLDTVRRVIESRFRTPAKGERQAELMFLIRRDGSVVTNSLSFVNASGSFAFDQEARGAIESAGAQKAFGPLPAGFAGEVLPVVVTLEARGPEFARRYPLFEFQVDKQAVPDNGNPPPRYLVRSESARAEGEVLVQFVVDTTGHVDMSSFRVFKATNGVFVEEVRRVLPLWKFSPAEIAGRKVKQFVQQLFVFSRPPR